jgi:hypothetical protein
LFLIKEACGVLSFLFLSFPDQNVAGSGKYETIDPILEADIENGKC